MNFITNLILLLKQRRKKYEHTRTDFHQSSLNIDTNFASKFIDCGEAPLFSLRYGACLRRNDSGGKSQVSQTEGKAMMFLIRTAFWLMIIILLLPTDEQQQSKVYGTAEATVKDVVTFCDRNPQTCTTGRDAFEVLVNKAEFGAHILMGFIKDQTGVGSDETESSGASAASPAMSGDAPASWDRGVSQDTLNPKDREAAWGGPDGAGT